MSNTPRTDTRTDIERVCFELRALGFEHKQIQKELNKLKGDGRSGVVR